MAGINAKSETDGCLLIDVSFGVPARILMIRPFSSSPIAMPVPKRPRSSSGHAGYQVELTDDGSSTLVRLADEVRFHSGCGAAAECDHVYIHNGTSGWKDIDDRAILEVGLGTGLSMLRTVDWFLSKCSISPKCSISSSQLRYVALESAPLPASVLRSLHLERGLINASLATSFLSWWQKAQSGHSGGALHWEINDRCDLTVHQVNARHWLKETDEHFDTVYFDPFDVETNPELWQADVFADLHGCTRLGGRLVSYCVKSSIRQQLNQVGFMCECVPGPPGGKREVLIATRR